MPAATKTVTGNLGNLSEAAIASAQLLFDLDPAYVIVDGLIIVGVINGGTKGVPVTPDPDTGDFTVDIVAVDNPTWTITVSITGAGIETPIIISIKPPPASGSGDVEFESLIVAGSAGTAPVMVNTIRGAQDYDDSTAPTPGQAILWNGADYAPGDVAGGSGLPDGGAPGQILTKVSSDDGDADWATPPSSITQTQADQRYAPIAAGMPALIWTGTAYPAKPTGVTNAEFQGPASQDPGVAAVDGDHWAQTS